MGVKDLLEVLSAHAVRSAGLGGDDIIDSQNHDGGLGCRVDGLGFNPERLDNSQFQHVHGLTCVHVQASALDALLMLAS
jgi:hypothetical protein